MESLLNENPFDSIEFYRRDLVNSANIYRVYTGLQEYTEVEATSAYEAMIRSEIQKPLKIARYAVRNLPVLPHAFLVEPAAPTAH